MTAPLTRAPRRGRALLLSALAAATLSACVVGDVLLGNYRGPLPEQVNLVEEEVIVRGLSRDSSGPRTGLVTSTFLDRVRYLSSGDLKSVNRVIFGQTWTLGARIDSLGIAVGDTVIISTEYASVHRGGTAVGVVPEWPGTGEYSYPVGWHIVKEIRRK